MQHFESSRKSTTHSALIFLLAIAGVPGLVQPAAAQSANAPVVYLDQAWSPADRETYYNISQGSSVMEYDIFLNLELADSQELFRSDANSNRFGMITQAPNPRTNPDGLPVGLARWTVTEGRWKGDHIGLTCAACHNAQLNYKGQRIRIDGGVGNTFDFVAYIAALDRALQAALNDKAKFDRLARRVGASSPKARADLRKHLESDTQRVHYYSSHVLLSPTAAGPARMDAISAIINRVTSLEPGIPENLATPVAPTKPPFLWNAPQGSWTQWRGVQQDPIDRNFTEGVGVYLSFDLKSATPAEGLYSSSAALPNLARIEGLLQRLAPPKWPEDLFGKIDRNKAEIGKALFANNCAQCHNMWPYTWTEANKYGKRFVEVGLVPARYVGTDPGQFRDIRPYAFTGHLSGQLPERLRGEAIVPTGELYFALKSAVLDTALAKLKLTDDERVALHGYREFPLPPPPRGVYKAAPRDGVWATPPFMHNGSVPNLYEMLVPASERSKKFYVGREFDPVKVGLDTSGKSGDFLYDTSLPGNSNQGHSFESGPVGNGIVGPLLTEEQRWAIVEYLKSIPEEPARVTPFGGPPNARTGNAPWGKVPAQ